MSVTKEEDPTPRPMTSNITRSPRKLPKLSGQISNLPQVEDLEEDEEDGDNKSEARDDTSMSIPSAVATPVKTADASEGTEDNNSPAHENKSVPPSSRSSSRVSSNERLGESETKPQSREPSVHASEKSPSNRGSAVGSRAASAKRKRSDASAVASENGNKETASIHEHNFTVAEAGSGPDGDEDEQGEDERQVEEENANNNSGEQEVGNAEEQGQEEEVNAQSEKEEEKEDDSGENPAEEEGGEQWIIYSINVLHREMWDWY